MKVIGVGLGRTGTNSLKESLNILGFGPCYHMSEIYESIDDEKLWLEVYKCDNDGIFNKIFKKYNSTVDNPSTYFYKRLIKLYPEAKVVLTIRDVNDWYKSAKNTIYPESKSLKAKISCIISPRFKRICELHNIVTWEGIFNNNFSDEEYSKNVFINHIEEVKNFVQKDKLLIFNVKEGWEPLCNFLDVPVPDLQFPYTNNTLEFNKNHKKQLNNIYIKFVIYLFSILIIISISKKWI